MHKSVHMFNLWCRQYMFYFYFTSPNSYLYKTYHHQSRFKRKHLNCKSNNVTQFPYLSTWLIPWWFSWIYIFWLIIDRLFIDLIISFTKSSTQLLINSKSKDNLSSHSSWAYVHSFLKSYSIVFKKFDKHVTLKPWPY